MSKKNWGDIYYTDTSTEEEEPQKDEIELLAEKSEALRKEKIIPNDGESWENAKKRREKEISDIETEIWKKIYAKRLKEQR